MRILQVTGTTTGGVARHVSQVVDVLRSHGHDVRLAGPAGVVADVVLGAPVPAAVVDLRDRPSGADLATVRRLRHLAAGADVVHAHGLRAGAAAALAVRSLPRRPRLVVTEHNLAVGSARVRAIAQALEAVVARGADVVLPVAPDLAERARRLGARHVEVAVIPAPAPRAVRATAAEVRRDLGLLGGQRLVLSVARLAPQKGLDLLVDAAAAAEQLLPARTDGAPAAVWCVAGGGPLGPEVAAAATAAGAPVRVLGPRADVPDLLAAADVVVSTSVWEGQPISLGEAMHAGAAVVATEVGGTGLVVGDAALLTGRDAAEVSAAVVQVLLDTELAGRLGDRARRRSAELPDEGDLHRQLVSVYEPGSRC
ncbi:glycosyltransferase family 4 protein [Georgenia sp. Z1491]|uniref:glycosyltransferase family 4 protein n=1 Tax=Georgenia sp. Z1491 TaxID=3416707 RepID=UPI003CECED9D